MLYDYSFIMAFIPGTIKQDFHHVQSGEDER